MCPSLQSPPPGCPAGDSGWSHSSVTGQQECLGGWSKEQQRLVNRGAWWKHVCVCGKSAVCSHYVHWQWPEDHAKGTPASYSSSQPPVFSGSVCIWDCVCVCVSQHMRLSLYLCVYVWFTYDQLCSLGGSSLSLCWQGEDDRLLCTSSFTPKRQRGLCSEHVSQYMLELCFVSV